MSIKKPMPKWKKYTLNLVLITSAITALATVYQQFFSDPNELSQQDKFMILLIEKSEARVEDLNYTVQDLKGTTELLREQTHELRILTASLGDGGRVVRRTYSNSIPEARDRPYDEDDGGTSGYLSPSYSEEPPVVMSSPPAPPPPPPPMASAPDEQGDPDSIDSIVVVGIAPTTVGWIYVNGDEVSIAEDHLTVNKTVPIFKAPPSGLFLSESDKVGLASPGEAYKILETQVVGLSQQTWVRVADVPLYE